MKKAVRKLALSKETLWDLNVRPLQTVAGGTSTTCFATSCHPISICGSVCDGC